MNKQVLVLLFVVFFGFLGLAMPYPIFAPLFLHPHLGGFISTQWSLAVRSIFLGITLAAYPFGQFIGSPLLGGLSDHWGRKTLLFSSLLGASLCYVISGVAIHCGMIWLLILSRLVTGFLEGNLAIAQASIADLSIDKHKGFGALSAMTSLGYVFGPLLGGVLSNQHMMSGFNFSMPFYAASAIALLTSIIVLIWTQETLTKYSLRKKSLTQQLNLWKRLTELSKNENLKWLLINGFFLCISVDIYYEFFPAFLVGRWQMTTIDIALYNVVLSVALMIGSFCLPSLLRLKFTAYNSLLLMIIILPSAYVFMLLTKHTYFLNLQFTLIGLSFGAANTFHTVLVSNSANNNQQGEAMGLRWGLRMLGDTLICIFGGLLIIISVNLPIIIAIATAMLSLWLFYKRKDYF